MKVLPPKTLPSRDRIRRAHSPRRRSYRGYRPCLQWEFGFTCAYCLIHEADLNEHGLHGLGLMWIEHYVPRSRNPALADDYANCFYSCLFCNQSRSDRPEIEHERRLLDPCTVPWADHFDLVEFVLQPKDPSAEYTASSYDLNEPRRLQVRRSRYEAVTESLHVIKRGPALVKDLLALAALVPWSERASLLEAAANLRHAIGSATRQLIRLQPIPLGAGRLCACDAELDLPPFLREQVLDVRVSGS